MGQREIPVLASRRRRREKGKKRHESFYGRTVWEQKERKTLESSRTWTEERREAVRLAFFQWYVQILTRRSVSLSVTVQVLWFLLSLNSFYWFKKSTQNNYGLKHPFLHAYPTDRRCSTRWFVSVLFFWIKFSFGNDRDSCVCVYVCVYICMCVCV